MIPDPILALLNSLIVFLVTAGVKSLSLLLGKDLNGYAAALAALVVAVVVFGANTLLASLDAATRNQVIAFLTFLAGLFGAMGFHSVVKKFSGAK